MNVVHPPDISVIIAIGVVFAWLNLFKQDLNFYRHFVTADNQELGLVHQELVSSIIYIGCTQSVCISKRLTRRTKEVQLVKVMPYLRLVSKY